MIDEKASNLVTGGWSRKRAVEGEEDSHVQRTRGRLYSCSNWHVVHSPLIRPARANGQTANDPTLATHEANLVPKLPRLSLCRSSAVACRGC